MKAKYDIYIRKNLQARLDQEPNMSGLINDLLEKYYDKQQVKIEPLETKPSPLSVTIERVKEIIDTPDEEKVDTIKYEQFTDWGA